MTISGQVSINPAIDGSNLQPYEPRKTTFIEKWNVDEWQFKVYYITCRTPPLDPIVLCAARSKTQLLLEAIGQGDEGYRSGFVIIHAGVDSVWLFVGWWAYDNILCSALASAPLDDPGKFETYEGAAMACAFELGIVDFERRAWIEFVLSGDRRIEHYMAEKLSDGFY